MKTIKNLFIYLGLIFIISACQKDYFEQSQNNENNSNINSMDELLISDNFDWKTTKTLNVQIILPFGASIQQLNIISPDGLKKYFSGYPEDGSYNLKTKITVPSYEEILQIEYGNGLKFETAVAQINGNSLYYDFNNITKGVTDDCGPCDGQVTSLTLRYDGTITGATIKVTKATGGQDVLYEDIVQPGGEFTFVGTGNNNQMGSKINIYINDVFNVQIHTSCSEPILAGMTFGDFFIVAGESLNGGPLCDNTGGGGSTVETGGCLAFEDLWPAKGDYDFNDLVIDYNFSITKNEQEEVENITATFITKAFGASYLNGFGFTFPNISPDAIINVNGYDIGAGSIFNLASNNLESGQSNATIIVFDNAYRIMQHPGIGIGVNTEHIAPFITPDTIVMQIAFMENGVPAPGGPVTFSELDIGNFNPFIVVNQDRGKEVHLPDYPPTDLIDEGYFGTINDDSNPAEGRYYKTVNNLPWAIHIPESFEHPIEKQDIIGAYLKFAEWAESDGVLYPDWYQDEPGYRNENLIY